MDVKHIEQSFHMLFYLILTKILLGEYYKPSFTNEGDQLTSVANQEQNSSSYYKACSPP